jgi:putative ABC transport system substrate-binding protein
VALLVNPIDRVVADLGLRASQAAARTLGLDLHVLNASTESDFDGVFANLANCERKGS